jgi:Thiolase, C-terminal domain
MLGTNEAAVNVNGGSVALGHALGSTGARMVVTLIHELRRRGDRLRAVTLCDGGGQGEASSFALVAPRNAWAMCHRQDDGTPTRRGSEVGASARSVAVATAAQRAAHAVERRGLGVVLQRTASVCPEGRPNHRRMRD